MIHFRIVTPERVLLETEVDSVSLPTPMGEITVLEHHIPLVSNLEIGELRYRKGNHVEHFAVSGGFIEVQSDNKVVVLADTAEFGHEIDVQRAQEARDKAKLLMQTHYHDEVTSASAAAILQKNLTRLRVAHKHRSRHGSKLNSP